MKAFLERYLARLSFFFVAALVLVGCTTMTDTETQCAIHDGGDCREEAVRKMSDDTLPSATNAVLDAWQQAGDKTVQRKMYAAIRQALQKGSIHYTEDLTNYTLRATIQTDGLFHHLDMTIVVGAYNARCYHSLPILIDPALRGEVAKLIAQINAGFSYGAFEMDLVDTGEISFRHVLPFEAIKYGGGKRIGDLLLGGWATITSHDKILLSVCGGAMTFAEAWAWYVTGTAQGEDLKGSKDEEE